MTDDTVALSQAIRECPEIRTETKLPNGQTAVLWWQDNSEAQLQEDEERLQGDDATRKIAEYVVDEYLVRDEKGQNLDADDLPGQVWINTLYLSYLEDALGVADDVIQAAIEEHIDEMDDEGNG